jgi:3-dehydrotetronate 4-kinase
VPIDAPRPLLGCIADDFTGGTDLASTLVNGGMRTVQAIGIPQSSAQIKADALVVALKSRTISVSSAIEQSLAALDWLRAQGCRQFFFKYCSTFDSTDAGNIGPVAEALLNSLSDGQNASLAIACPAYPENGRSVYHGHLFVGDALLNESGMENHPLTPMRDANLVRVLQRQTTSGVALIRHDVVAQGVDAVRASIETLRQQGARFAIADAISNEALHTLGNACADLSLVTGGSGMALGLPENFRRAGLLGDAASAGNLPLIGGKSAILAGSASKATNAQVAEWRTTRPAFRIDPLAVARGERVVESALTFAREYLDSSTPTPVLIYATASPDDVTANQRALGVTEAGLLVEQALASIARGLHEQGVRKFVVAGGETSGAVVQALGVKMLHIGKQIDPGVPITVTTDNSPLALVLKSGNFGTVDFFAKALSKLEAGEQ